MALIKTAALWVAEIAMTEWLSQFALMNLTGVKYEC